MKKLKKLQITSKNTSGISSNQKSQCFHDLGVISLLGSLDGEWVGPVSSLESVDELEHGEHDESQDNLGQDEEVHCGSVGDGVNTGSCQ